LSSEVILVSSEAFQLYPRVFSRDKEPPYHQSELFPMLKITVLGLYALNKYVFSLWLEHVFFWVSLTFITIFIFMSYRVALIQASLCCQFVRWIAVLKLCKHLFDAIKNGYVNAACKDKEEQTERKMRITEIAFITLPGCFKSVAW